MFKKRKKKVIAENIDIYKYIKEASEDLVKSLNEEWSFTKNNSDELIQKANEICDMFRGLQEEDRYIE